MHSLVIVAETEGTNYEALMAPYSEGLEVEKYLIGPVDEAMKLHFLEYYNTKEGIDPPLGLDQFEDAYAKYGRRYNDGMWEKDSDGNWGEYSDFNPEGKWDYYRVGGRYVGLLKLREGAEEIAPLNFTWEWPEGKREEMRSATPKLADRARLKDIINLEDLLAEAVVTEAEGWVDIPSENWQYAPVAPYLRDLPGDTIITCIDYHN